MGAAAALVLLAGCTTERPSSSSGPDGGPDVPVATVPASPVGPDVTASPTPSATASPSPSATASPAPLFRSAVSEISPELAARMATSWRPGCPVPLEDLRYLTVTHVDFEGTVQTGELVVHADVADSVVRVFGDLYAAGYPVRLMRLVDDYGGDDTRSMDADNTSAFNCRAITGGTSWSEHAYGRALDLNPVENPYVLGDHVAPRAGEAYVDRPDVPGVVRDDDVVVRAFAAVGWQWGGYWDGPVDYQHFSVTGR